MPLLDTRTPIEPLRGASDVNGTDAIMLALRATGVGPGDEAARTHLAIPMSPGLSRAQAAEVAAAVRDADLDRPH